MIYTDKIENHKLGMVTSSKKMAEKMGWTLAFENEQAELSDADCGWYEKGFAPMKTNLAC